MSRLMQACGLKQYIPGRCGGDWTVTPHAGVWIETDEYVKSTLL